MPENQQLNAPEQLVADFWRRKAAGELTEENRLASINRMRAQSGDRPLTMAEHLAIEEDSKNGIHFYTPKRPKSFIKRLLIALKHSRAAFFSSLRRSR